jgi:hypothetical protein
VRHAFFKSLGRLLLAPFRLLFGLLRLAMALFRLLWRLGKGLSKFFACSKRRPTFSAPCVGLVNQKQVSW